MGVSTRCLEEALGHIDNLSAIRSIGVVVLDIFRAGDTHPVAQFVCRTVEVTRFEGVPYEIEVVFARHLHWIWRRFPIAFTNSVRPGDVTTQIGVFELPYFPLVLIETTASLRVVANEPLQLDTTSIVFPRLIAVTYTHLRAHETAS